ncbi:MAG: MBL fold metallo-hydrolase [Alphaproteobacteria bacterium]|nr:MBL fold metallo-hydrolase [Alphaproteobacteria bacterium]
MNALSHQDVIVATLGSGSRGNSTYIGTERSGVLIDCGLSTKQIFRRLEELGLGETLIEGVLITHEHSDHVGAARVLDRTLHKRTGRHVPFYMSRGTRAGLHQNCVPTRVERVQSGRPFQVGAFHVEPWTVPHDTVDPLAYAVAHGEVRAGVITDLGRPTRLVERQFGSLDIAVLEFNHDLQMLIEGDYPWRLKQRVKGAHGHLSNEQAGDVVRRGSAGRLKHLVLAHLSEDNNHPDAALVAAERALLDARAAGVTVHVASQQLPLGPIRVRTPRNLRPTRPSRTASRRPVVEAPTDDRQLSLFA